MVRGCSKTLERKNVMLEKGRKEQPQKSVRTASCKKSKEKVGRGLMGEGGRARRVLIRGTTGGDTIAEGRPSFEGINV